MLFFALLEKAAGRWTDQLIVINDHDLAEARRLRIVPVDRVVRHNGIGLDLEHYRSSPELTAQARQVRHQLQLAADVKLLVMVAEMVPRKNHVGAIKALALARSRGWSGHLALAGSGPLEPDLRRLCRRLGVHEHVTFLGSVRDVRPLMLAGEALVLPSRQEGLSRAVMEALALGRPVIGSRSRGVADLLDENCGIVVDADDFDSLAQAYIDVRRLPTGDKLVETLQERLQSLSIEALLARHEEIYLALRTQRIAP